MRLHTVGESPRRFAAGALGKMTELRFDDAEIALRQCPDAAETVAWLKLFVVR